MIRSRRIFKALAAGAVLMGSLALALVLLRDRPRRMTEEGLTERIGVPVRVSRLTPLGLDHWRLEGVRLEAPPAWPWIHTIRIDRLDAEGNLRDMLAGRFRAITIHGATIHAQPTNQPVPQLPPSTLTIERLEVEASQLVATAPGGLAESPLAFGAEIEAIGRAPHGKVTFDAPSFDPRPWLRLGDWTPAGDPPQDFRASCTPKPARADLLLETPEPGALEIAVHASLPWTEQTSLTFRREASRTTALSLVLDGVDPLCWLPPTEGLRYEGTIDIRAEQTTANMPTHLRVKGTLSDLTWRAEPTATDLRGTDLRGDALALLLETSIPAKDSDHEVPGDDLLDAGPAPGAIVAHLHLSGLRGQLAGQPLPANGGQPLVDTVDARLDGVLDTADGLSLGGAWTVRLGTGLNGAGPSGAEPSDAVATNQGSTFAAWRAEGAVWRTPGWKWPVADLKWTLDEIAAEPVLAWLTRHLPGYTVDARAIRAQGQLTDRLTAPTIRATVTVDQPSLVVAPMPWQLGTERVTAQVRLRPGDEQGEVTFEESTWLLEEPPGGSGVDTARVNRPGVAFPLAGRFQRFSRSAAAENGAAPRELATADLGALGSFHGVRTVGSPWVVTIRDAALSAWIDLARAGGTNSAIDAADSPRHMAITPTLPFAVTGTLDGQLQIASSFGAREDAANPSPAGSGPLLPNLEPANLRGVINLRDGGFTSADGARAAEGLRATSSVHLAHQRDSEGQYLRLEGDVEGPLVLWDTLFADFGTAPADFRVELRTASHASDTPEEPPWRLTASLTPSIDAGGSRLEVIAQASSGPTPDLDLRVQADDLSEAYDALIRQPFAGSIPRIDGLRLGGRGTARLAVSQRLDGQNIAGGLTLRDANLITAGDTLKIEGLGLDLPFDWFHREPPSSGAPSPHGTDAALAGRLAFDRMNVAGVGFANVAMPLTIEADSVRLAKPLTTAVAGGTVAFQDLAFRHLLSAERELTTAISLRTVDLGRLTRALELPTLAGRLDGEVPRVRLRATRFEVEGETSLQLFGGNVRLFDIAGRDFFSPFPRITFSADLNDLDLAQLTAAFELGRMAGRVDGTLRQCTLVGAQPVACAAEIASRQGTGGPRWIDVEAVNNLSVLGTGGGLQQGLARRFLRRFTYDKLGVSVRLADDRFLLRGLVRRRDKEFFLKGRLPFPIDIVNAEPGSSVSFESMLDRLRNLEQVRFTRGRSQPEDRP